MKLYTEEQVKRHKEILEDIIDLWDNGFPLDSNTITKCENALLKLKPIELPSDEEIEKEAKEWWAPSPFRGGIKWVIRQIKQQDETN